MLGITDSPVATPTFIEWGWFSISIPNLIVIGVMVLLFALAFVLPFPGSHGEDSTGDES